MIEIGHEDERAHVCIHNWLRIEYEDSSLLFHLNR